MSNETPPSASREAEELLFAADSNAQPLESAFEEPLEETSFDETSATSGTDTSWDDGAVDLFEVDAGSSVPPSPPGKAGAVPAKDTAPRHAAMLLSEPAPAPARTPAPTPSTAPVDQLPQGGARLRPTKSSYILAVGVLASGIGCGAVLWMTLGSLPLAIVSASLGAVGAAFSFVLTSR